MKTQILALALMTLATVSTEAHASSMQETCSNHEGTVKTSGGHGPWFTQYTIRDWNSGTDTVVRDEENALEVTELSRQNISEESNAEQARKTCKKGSTIGLFWKEVYVQNVKITKADGSKFEKGTLEATNDYSAIEASLICERVVTNIMPCGN